MRRSSDRKDEPHLDRGRITLAEWARRHDVPRQTAYYWYRQGNLPVPARKHGGRIYVAAASPEQGECVVYLHGEDTPGRAERLIAAARRQGRGKEPRVVREADGDRRSGLHALLADPAATIVVSDRESGFSPFAHGCVNAALSPQGRALVLAAGNRLPEDHAHSSAQFAELAQRFAAIGQEDLIDTSAVSEIIGVSNGVLRSWRARRQGPPWFKVGGRARYRESEVLAWMGERRRPIGQSSGG